MVDVGDVLFGVDDHMSLRGPQSRSFVHILSGIVRRRRISVLHGRTQSLLAGGTGLAAMVLAGYPSWGDETVRTGAISLADQRCVCSLKRDLAEVVVSVVSRSCKHMRSLCQ